MTPAQRRARDARAKRAAASRKKADAAMPATYAYFIDGNEFTDGKTINIVGTSAEFTFDWKRAADPQPETPFLSDDGQKINDNARPRSDGRFVCPVKLNPGYHRITIGDNKLEGRQQIVVTFTLVAPKPAPAIDVGPTYIDLTATKLEAGKAYDVRPGTTSFAGLRPPDGVTLRGAGVTVQIPNRDDAWCGFDVSGTKGVMLSGFTFAGLIRQTGAMSGSGCSDLTLDALKCTHRSGTIAQVTGDPTTQTGWSSNVTLTGDWTGGLTDKYGFFGNLIRGLKIRSLTLPSPTYETCIRLHEGIEDLDIDGLTLDTRPGIAFNDAANAAAIAAGQPVVFGKLPVAGRFHAGARWKINGLKWWGVLGFGPMTRDNGGDSLPDGAERTRVIGLRCTTVHATNLTGYGMLELNPGLSDAVFEDGRIDAPTSIGSMTFIGPFSVFEQQYPHPDRAHAGDPIRPAAVASFLRFALTNAGKTGVGFDRTAFPGITFPAGLTLDGKAVA